MLEERMMRFDKKDWDELMQWLDEVTEFISNSESKDTPAHAPIWIQVIENTTFEENALVAPKEWRPLCTTFTVYDFETNTCNGFIVKEILEDECIDCPYRKKRE